MRGNMTLSNDVINEKIEEIIICKKNIYFFRDHHNALIPWARLRNRYLEEPILLFSFDHHRDIIDPFTFYCYHNRIVDKQQLLDKIEVSDEQTINAAIENLRNDEHIKTALALNILQTAYIISVDNLGDFPLSFEEERRINLFREGDADYLSKLIAGNPMITPWSERTYPDSDIYMAPFLPEGVNSCGNEYDSIVLDDSFLSEKMCVLSRMSKGVINKNGVITCKYILDIDLDYFHKLESLSPKSYAIFGNLVKNAEIITVAEEPDCVELLKTEPNLTSEILKEKLLLLLKNILEEVR